ncbi:MAG: IS200/IS605 family transposase [Oligoflexus sp.]|nr:IS200/IS605 family transposase [Oligoflexus sp.]
MSDYRKGAHTVHDIKYHFVWITKYRYHVLRGDIAIRVRSILREVCMSYDNKIIKGAVSGDHIHMLVSCPPQLSPSKTAQLLKGRSSLKIQQEFPELKKRYWGQHIWARGYFCASSGSVSEYRLAIRGQCPQI